MVDCQPGLNSPIGCNLSIVLIAQFFSLLSLAFHLLVMIVDHLLVYDCSLILVFVDDCFGFKDSVAFSIVGSFLLLDFPI